jgi:hypothetical protein
MTITNIAKPIIQNPTIMMKCEGAKFRKKQILFIV